MDNFKYSIIGPCALESFSQINQVVSLAHTLNLNFIRAQIFKPRTNPESFQGLGIEGLEILKRVKEENKDKKIDFVMEACSEEQLKIVAPYAAMIQIGARNMQNFELLKIVGKYLDNQFVLLKRGFANTTAEWIASANYLILSGVPKEKIILCERGSRSITSETGISLDFISALEAKKLGYKVIIDPSHGTKKREYVIPHAKAAYAMDFDGVMLECHPNPSESKSDKEQALSLEEVKTFFSSL